MLPLGNGPTAENPFDPSAIQRTLDAALATIPPGQHGAVLLHVDLASGRPTGGITVAERLSNTWSLAAYGGVSVTAAGALDPTVGFVVKGSW